MKVMKWLLASIAVLGVLAVAHGIWAVQTFDTETLPAHHGKVVSTLFASDANGGNVPQAPIVTFGGSEGDNVWASPRLRAQRERFHTMGYAVLAIESPVTRGRREKAASATLTTQTVGRRTLPSNYACCAAGYRQRNARIWCMTFADQAATESV